MKVFEKLSSLIFKDSDDSLVESRRRFIKGAVGLAAIAVVASNGGLRLLNQNETQDLIKMVQSGLVENQTFILDKTAIFLDLKNVVFRGCEFVAAPGFVGDYLLLFPAATI